MKRAWMWLGAAAVLIAAALAIRAEANSWRGHHGHFGSWGPGWYAAHELDLSDAQKKQIETIWDGERPRVAGLVRELAAENTALHQASKENNEAELQEITAQQGSTIAKLLMEKERLCAQISGSVLNDEQRKKMDALQDRLNERLGSLADRLQQGGHHAD